MTRLSTYVLAAMSALALSMATACVNEDSPCPPDSGDDGGKGVTLQFTVVTHNAGSNRSAVSRVDDCIGDQNGSNAENFINTADCRFMLFDEDRKLLRPIFPEITGEDAVNYTWYNIKASITEKYFDEKVAAGEPVTFYIMVIANTSNLDGQYFTYSPGVTTIEDIAAQRRTFRQPEGYIEFLPDGFNSFVPWNPNIDGGRLIPMAGLQQFTVDAAVLKASTYEAPVLLSPDLSGGSGNARELRNINMLRALSKIEIIDKIDMLGGNYDPAQRPYVDKVELYGYFDSGTIMPYINDGKWSTAQGEWSMTSSGQVSAPTIPVNAEYTFPVINRIPKGSWAGGVWTPITDSAGNQLYDPQKGDCLTFTKDEDAMKLRDDGCNVFSGYVVEYSRAVVAGLKYDFDEWYDRYSYLEITVNNPMGDGKDDSPIYTMPLAKYSDGSPGAGIDELIRNHIYRYEITGINQTVNIIEVGFTVCDWNRKTVDIPVFD